MLTDYEKKSWLRKHWVVLIVGTCLVVITVAVCGLLAEPAEPLPPPPQRHHTGIAVLERGKVAVVGTGTPLEYVYDTRLGVCYATRPGVVEMMPPEACKRLLEYLQAVQAARAKAKKEKEEAKAAAEKAASAE